MTLPSATDSRRLALPVLIAALAGLVPLRAQDPVAKKPIPDAGSLEQALALVQEVYGDEFKRARDAAQKTALAEKLLQKAKESAADPTGQYALLKVAKDIAALAGDADLALFAVDDMAATFQIETFPTKVEALLKTAQAASQTKQHARIVRRAEPLIELAVQQDDFVTAGDLSQAALSAARKSADSDLVKKTVARGKEVDQMASAYAAVKHAIAKLKTDPVDPEANLAVGKYRCLVKGEWERGIPYLALGNDPALKELAIKELKGATDTDGQVALGDGWWDLAAASNGTAQKQLQARAAYWYRKALPAMTGLLRDKVEIRLETKSDAPDPIPDRLPACTLTSVREMNGFMRLEGNASIVTKESYSGPLDVFLIARTDSTNIRVVYGKASVIWNWERRKDELRVHRFDGSIARARVVPLQPETWYRLQWSIRYDAMRVFVNGRLVFFEKQRTSLIEKCPIIIHNAFGSIVDVQNVSIKKYDE